MDTESLRSYLARACLAVLALACVLVTASPLRAQTFSVIHNFTGDADGDNPFAGLTIDRAGNMEGTSAGGGSKNAGAVYKLMHSGAGWTVNSLYVFQGSPDGQTPESRVIIGPDGNLYGTTFRGGSGNCSDGPGCGIVYRLNPPPTFCRSVLCPWEETILYRFTGGADGGQPGFGDLLFDSAGNIYGTTTAGGAFNDGVVFKLIKSNGSWMESVLYSFTGGQDGGSPYGGLTFDPAGNLFGTTPGGGAYQGGTVYELTPSGFGWTEHTLHSLQPATEGSYSTAGLIFDGAGNLYGTAQGSGPNNGGTVFEMMPSGGSWNFTLLYALTGLNGGGGPASALTMDQSGNLYDTREGWIDGNDGGSVFELSRSAGGWSYTLLHQFEFNEGAAPIGGVSIGANGTLYGTASLGSTSPGTVWQITQ
jgi:uncharacterized repeat protein (TIGR03803 family)